MAHELKKWTPLLVSNIINSRDLDNIISYKSIKASTNIIIIPYSLLDKLEIISSNIEEKFDLIIADEAHKLRKSSSQVHKSFLKTKE